MLMNLKTFIEYFELQYIKNLPSHPTVSILIAQYSDMLISAAQDRHSAVKARQQAFSVA